MRREITIDELINYMNAKCGGISLTEKSILFDDLGINGLDAVTLMDDLATDFNFSLETFDYSKYFLSETELANTFRILFYSLFKKNKLPSKTFTIRHLLKVIERGVWFDPIE